MEEGWGEGDRTLPRPQSKTPRKRSGVSYATVRKLALALPGVEEGTSYGTQALRVAGKFFVRLREDGETLVVKVGDDERDLLTAADPATFFITDHYRGYPTVLVRLSNVGPDVLDAVLKDAWRRIAPKKLVAGYGGNTDQIRRRSTKPD